MKNHKPIIKPESVVKTHAGIAFVLSCCGQHEESVHIEQAGHYTRPELEAKIQRHIDRVAKNHHGHESALEHISSLTGKPIEDCGCK